MKFQGSGAIFYDNPQEVSKALNVYLANLQILAVKLKNMHWNIIGEGFFDIHPVLDDIYDHVLKNVDIIAERIVQIGYRPYGSMYQYVTNTTLKEISDDVRTDVEICTILIQDFQALLTQLSHLDRLIATSTDEHLKHRIGHGIKLFDKYHWMMSMYIIRLQNNEA